MRFLGLGISNDNFNSLQFNLALADKPADTFDVMSFLGLGVSNTNFDSL